jgi:hypothetical protein
MPFASFHNNLQPTMSVFDQSFNKPKKCFDLCNSHMHHLQQDPKDDGLTVEVKQEKQEIDDLLSQAFNELTFEEREEHQEVLHGVRDMAIEDESLVDCALQELESHLANTKTSSIYELAETMDAAYVSAKAFRVMFLRANEYDAKAAADQMLRFFESKHQLFGRDKLVKDITIADLDEDDVAYLKQSFLRFAGKDRSGRQVTVHIGAFVGGIVGALWSNKTLQNVLRAQYYGIMKALQSEETQMRGLVTIWYAIGDLKAKTRKGYFEGFMAARALPQTKAAIHLCVDDIRQYSLCSVVVKVRLRFDLQTALAFLFVSSTFSRCCVSKLYPANAGQHEGKI